MAFYKKQERRAENEFPSQPARATKIRAIGREARQRIRTQCADRLPNGTILLNFLQANGYPFEIPCLNEAARVERYGLRKARDMLELPLPQVVAYDPDLDTGWPF